MYYLFVFFSFSMLCTGLILLKSTFGKFAYASSKLLDCMMDSSMDESEKHRKLLQNLARFLLKFLLLLAFAIIIIGISLIPMILYMNIYSKSMQDLDISSIAFYSVMIASSIILFIFPLRMVGIDIMIGPIWLFMMANFIYFYLLSCLMVAGFGRVRRLRMS